MAIVCEENKILFSLNPRTASTALADCLIDNYGGKELLDSDLYLDGNFIDKKHVRFEEIEKFKLFESYCDFKKVTTIRNPFDSIVSGFFNRLKYLSYLDDPNFFANKINFYEKGEIEVLEKKNFNKWILFKYSNSKYRGRTQNQQWTHGADIILRFENIQNDFNALCEQLNIKKITIPVSNTNNRKKDYKFYYNFISMKIMKNLFQRDFLEFGYEF